MAISRATPKPAEVELDPQTVKDLEPLNGGAVKAGAYSQTCVCGGSIRK